MANYDYDFDLGKGRRLQGRGPRGLIALALLLGCFLAMALAIGPPLASGVSSTVSQLIFEAKKLW